MQIITNIKFDAADIDRRLITDDNKPLNSMEFEIAGILKIIQHFLNTKQAFLAQETRRAAKELKYPGDFNIEPCMDHNGTGHTKILANFEYWRSAAKLNPVTKKWKFYKP